MSELTRRIHAVLCSTSFWAVLNVSDVKVSNENGHLSRNMSIVFQPSGRTAAHHNTWMHEQTLFFKFSVCSSLSASLLGRSEGTHGNLLNAQTHCVVVVFILFCALNTHNTPLDAPTTHVAHNNTAHSSWSLSYSKCCVVVVLSYSHGPCCRVIFACWCHGGCRHVGVVLLCSCRRLVVERPSAQPHSTQHTNLLIGMKSCVSFAKLLI